MLRSALVFAAAIRNTNRKRGLVPVPVCAPPLQQQLRTSWGAAPAAAGALHPKSTPWTYPKSIPWTYPKSTPWTYSLAALPPSAHPLQTGYLPNLPDITLKSKEIFGLSSFALSLLLVSRTEPGGRCTCCVRVLGATGTAGGGVNVANCCKRS